jgi:N-acetylmuramoyl-L-alanine amidase
VTGLPLRLGDASEAVRDVQRRLAARGYDVPAEEAGVYGPVTEAVIRRFQESRGLRIDGIVGRQTWSSLVEAGYDLGDRFLYLRQPMLRGDDVADLQARLGALGFDAGRGDGIFGTRTAQALVDFQRNAGLTTDGICGTDTVAALHRLGARGVQPTTVAKLREEERLLDAPRKLLGRRIAVGELGGLAGLVDTLAHVLLDAGAVVAALHHPDGSVQAEEANDFKAEAFVGVALLDGPACVTSYFATDRFESIGGRNLAELASAEVCAVMDTADGTVAGMRLPVLRETRMPAVVCEVGPPATVVERGAALVAALSRAINAWVEDPLGT